MKKQSATRGFPVPDVDVDGEVIELDPPRKLIQTWRMLKTLLETRASQPTLIQQPAEALLHAGPPPLLPAAGFTTRSCRS